MQRKKIRISLCKKRTGGIPKQPLQPREAEPQRQEEEGGLEAGDREAEPQRQEEEEEEERHADGKENEKRVDF